MTLFHWFETTKYNEDIPYPFQARETDAGYDIFAAETKWIWPLTTKTIKSNHAIHIEDGLFGLIQSRSGIRSRGMIIDGVIDEGYQGFFGLIISNVNLIPRRIKAGDRVAQIIFLEPKKVGFIGVDQFSKTSDRGKDGGVWRKKYQK